MMSPQRQVDGWTVTATHERAYAHSPALQASTTVFRFPVGYRIGHVWVDDTGSEVNIPSSVRTTATALARELDKEER